MLIEDLTLIKILGKGSFGEVYLTSKQGTKEKYATKKINKKYALNEKNKKYIDNEINILKEVSHDNIIKLIDIKETTSYYFIVMELCNGGSLSDCLQEYQKKYKKPFSEEIVQYLMNQIVSAIKYLHNKNILHRDIKLDNILVNFDSEKDKKNLNMLKAKIKIIDFGFARHISSSELAKSVLGSPINMDPLIFQKMIQKREKLKYSNNFTYDQKADIWSLGTICYEMLMGKFVFDAQNINDLSNKIKIGDFVISTELSKEAFYFLKGMLQYDFKKRLTANQLFEEDFLRKPCIMFSKINDINNKDEIKMNIYKSIYIPHKEKPSPPSPPIGKKPPINEEEKNLDNLFMESFYNINDDFIYIEPKLIPLIPGSLTNLINEPLELNI
jgi:calcium-dependent protein kinase